MRDLGMSIGWGSGCLGWTCLRCCKKGRHAPKKHQLRLLQRQMFGWWANCDRIYFGAVPAICEPNCYGSLIHLFFLPWSSMEDGGNFGVYQELLQVSLQGSKNCKNSWHFYDFLCPSQLELRVFQAKVMYDAGCAPTVVKDRSSRAKPSHVWRMFS